MELLIGMGIVAAGLIGFYMLDCWHMRKAARDAYRAAKAMQEHMQRLS